MDKNVIGLAPMPSGTADHVTLIGGAYTAIAPNATPEQIDAAFKYITFKYNSDITKQNDVEAKEISGISGPEMWISNNDTKKSESYNVNPNYICLFNEITNISYRTEEETCAQDLYAILDLCIQEVLSNKNADCKQILDDASKKFQKNHLDYE